jgi:sulfonate transport system substrate-binding protein
MPRQADRGEARGFIGLGVFVAASVALLFAFAPNRRHGAERPTLALSAPLPQTPPPGTTLTVGDPVSQWVFEHNGWDKQLPFHIKWAQISGGPDVTEAFHAHALDVGLGANMPPIHAVWVGLPVKIIAFREQADPIAHPSWVLGVAPRAGVDSLADLKGKRIAFSPSQVQSEVVIQTLDAAGLKKSDVTLVELPSNMGGDVYTTSLGGGAVDVAPLANGIVAAKYVRRFGAAGAKLLPHPPFRDDPVALYTPVDVLQDPAKAAALRIFVRYWGLAQAWEKAHPDELAQGYYVEHQGLKPADATLIVQALGDPVIPRDWRGAIAYQQAAVDLMGPEVGHARFDAHTLFDPRFEHLAADGASTQVAAVHPPCAKRGEVAPKGSEGPRDRAKTDAQASSALSRGPLPAFGRTPPSKMGEMSAGPKIAIATAGKAGHS